MRAITIHEPYATAIVTGVKRYISIQPARLTDGTNAAIPDALDILRAEGVASPRNRQYQFTRKAAQADFKRLRGACQEQVRIDIQEV